MRRLLPSLLLLTALVSVGCGGASGGSSTAPPASAAEFPVLTGKTLQSVMATLPAGPIFAPSVSVFRVGQNRLGFALFSIDHKQISNAQVALYTSDSHGGSVAGPYPAHEESLIVDPQFQSETVAKDPGAARSVYVAQVPFSRQGQNEVFAIAKAGGKLEFASGSNALVGAPGGPPDVGQQAIAVHTPTVAPVGRRNVSQIDTRVPPATDLQQVDFASVLGKKPAVLLFATPQLCVSRVCGPVVDVEDEVKSRVGGRVAFIHMEIWKNNQINNNCCVRPQVSAYRLPSEPWGFVIDSRGRIVQRFEGAFSAAELKAAVQNLT